MQTILQKERHRCLTANMTTCLLALSLQWWTSSNDITLSTANRLETSEKETLKLEIFFNLSLNSVFLPYPRKQSPPLPQPLSPTHITYNTRKPHTSTPTLMPPSERKLTDDLEPVQTTPNPSKHKPTTINHVFHRSRRPSIPCP